MFILSTKITKKKILALAVACCCIAAILIVAIPVAASRTEEVATYNASTNEERITFLSGLGWTVNSTPSEVSDIVIPTVFDAAYESYNELQQDQGMDLSEFKGEKGVRYTYTVTNYPGQPESEVVANLIVVGGKVVAGDVSSAALGGFMHGLAKPAISTDTDASDQESENDTAVDVIK